MKSGPDPRGRYDKQGKSSRDAVQLLPLIPSYRKHI